MTTENPEQREGGGSAPLETTPSPRSLRLLIALRLVVISAIFLGVLVIQAGASKILPLSTFYGLFLLTYGLSLAYLILFLKRVSTRLQVILQLIGDIGIITGFVYATGGLYSPFSFLYLTVIVEASVFLRRWGYLFAGLSAVAYGVLVDLMFFDILPIAPNLLGGTTVPDRGSVLNQLLVHVVGFILVTFLVYRLIGSHRRLEEESERARQFVALTDHVVRSVSTGIVATDLEGCVLHLNQAGAEILHIANQEIVIGSDVDEIIPLNGGQWQEIFKRAEQQPVRIKEQIDSIDTHLGVTVGPLTDEHGIVVGYVINFQDLTEAERAGEHRRLQERMAAVGELAARMAHEVKNPLASISGSAQMLSSLEGVDGSSLRLLEIVVNESRRLSAILDGYLDYTRPRKTARARCDISLLLQGCFDLLKRSDEVLESHRLRLHAPEQLIIEGDEDQLRQVFWNLSRNAIQALPQGGELKITATATDSTVTLVWQDTGVGMPEEIRRRAFEPFVTTDPGGTGLGLAVVYSAVKDHGGSISIKSTPGKGTVVTVVLPRNEVAA
jgi:two-component system sensor histidine kinase PilS (NtrC family)